MIKSLEMLCYLFLVLLKLHLIFSFEQSISSYMNPIAGFVSKSTNQGTTKRRATTFKHILTYFQTLLSNTTC